LLYEQFCCFFSVFLKGRPFWQMTQQGSARETLSRGHGGRPSGHEPFFSYDPRVSPEEAIRALVEVAAGAGVLVRIEPFALALSGKGGLCRIDGQLVVLVDAKLSVVEQAGVIGEALGEVDLGGVTVPAEASAYVGTGHGAVKALVRPRPLVRVK
jgi:hypothetical protein